MSGLTKPAFIVYATPALLLAAIVLAELVGILALNHGRFIYTLDDPYIHLALSSHIRHGWYGINSTEFAAPSSSILWPLLLAPFADWPFHFAVPLILNIAAALVTVLLYTQIAHWSLQPLEPERKRRMAVIALACLLIPLTNVVGLIFSGMEHSLQLLATTAVIAGLIVEAHDRRVTAWLAVAIVVGPLLRYENLAISAPALLYLALRGHGKTALSCGLALGVALGAFSLFLHHLGLNLLPTSVMAKSEVVRASSLQALLINLADNLDNAQSTVFMVAATLLVIISASGSRPMQERYFAGVIASAIALHMAVGRFGWYHRYEIYMFAAMILSLLYLYRVRLLQWIEQQARASFAVMIVLSAILGHAYINVLRTIPVAANNIYLQQYQMHRFVSEFIRAPVAVHDLGLVAYRNDQYVLDLAGLASPEALAHRQTDPTTAWMDDMARAHNVKFAMIYDSDFKKLPADWYPLGQLQLQRKLITPTYATVSFYSLDARKVALMRHSLALFSSSLPAGAVFLPAAP